MKQEGFEDFWSPEDNDMDVSDTRKNRRQVRIKASK